MTQQQIHKPLAGKPNQSWNYSSGTTNLLSGILRQQFKNHQDYLDFWYTELIDKIGMSSMTIETDLAGNYVGSSYAWQLQEIGLNLVCYTYIKETGTEHKFLMLLGLIMQLHQLLLLMVGTELSFG